MMCYYSETRKQRRVKSKMFIAWLFISAIFRGVISYPSFQTLIPNGDRVPHPCEDSTTWEGVGHQEEHGGGALNPFGLDLYHSKIETGKIWTKSVCEADSDGDGKTNGQELGDPDCVWTNTNNYTQQASNISHPGICEPLNSETCQIINQWLQCHNDEPHCHGIHEPDVKELTIRMPETKVPVSSAKYMCTYFNVPLEKDYHVVAIRPFLDNYRVVHHMVLFGCKDDANQTKVNTPEDCDEESPPNCSSLAVWSIGIELTCYSRDFGILIGKNGFTRFMLQMHWHNSEHRDDLTDSSGLTLYYTPHLRPYNGGMLVTGQTIIELEPRKSDIRVDGKCPAVCSKMTFKGPIFIYSTMNHMHKLGRHMKVEHYRNGRLIDVVTDSNVTFSKTEVITLKKPVKFLPGDELRITCSYDTTSSETSTHYGLGADNEMCFAFLTIYPIENANSLTCHTFGKFSTCLLRTVESVFEQMKKNPFLKLGVKSVISSMIKHG